MVHALIKLTGTQDRSFKNSIGSIPVPKLTLNQLGKPSFWINVSLSYHIYIYVYTYYILYIFPKINHSIFPNISGHIMWEKFEAPTVGMI
jgi:hypothetical protein